MRIIVSLVLCAMLCFFVWADGAAAEETSEEPGGLYALAERISLGGAIEAEFGFESTDWENASDIVLATVELGMDIDIAEHVSGHLLFLYEEDDTEPMDVDEGFITLDGLGDLPMSLSAGKMYVPFGYFESHFVSDPMTLELGETNQSGVSVSFAGETVEITGVMFNGDVDEAGDDDCVGSFALGAVVAFPGDPETGVGIVAGTSFISNIADTDGLEGETRGEVSSHVGGFSAFVSVCFMETFFVEFEYLGAMDDFEAGELSFDGGATFSPNAMNLELAIAAAENVEVAARYESGGDLGDLLPEDRYGAVVAWGLLDNTCLALEYLHGEFSAGDEVDVVTAQLAVEF